MNFEKYSDWFVGCINCKECEKYLLEKRDIKDGRIKGFICNDNIDTKRIDKSQYPIRPQAGYIDEEWFEDTNAIRILLLGQNPRDGYIYDEYLYPIYEEIIKSVDKESIVHKKMYDKQNGIKKQVKNYKPTSLLQEEIVKIFKSKGKEVVFASANQILCRTEPEAGGIRYRSLFNDVYKKCFKTNVEPLINKIRPQLIIVLGWTTESPFEKLISNSSCLDFIKYVVVPHPTRRKTEALYKIEEFINNSF